MPFPMEKNLYGYVSKLTRDVSKKSVLQLIEEDRVQKLEMNLHPRLEIEKQIAS